MYNTNSFTIRLMNDKYADDEISLIPLGSDFTTFYPVNLPIDLTWGDRQKYEAGSDANYAIIMRKDENQGKLVPSLISVDYLDPESLPAPDYEIPDEDTVMAVMKGFRHMYGSCCEIERMGIDLVPFDLPFSTVSRNEFDKAISEWTGISRPGERDVERSMLRDVRDGIDRLGNIMAERLGIPVDTDCVFTVSGGSGEKKIERASGGRMQQFATTYLFAQNYFEYSFEREGSEVLVKDIPVSSNKAPADENGVRICIAKQNTLERILGKEDFLIFGSGASPSAKSNLISVARYHEPTCIPVDLMPTALGWIYISCMLSGICSARNIYPFKMICE